MPLKEIKQQFMAMRNGIVADTLRKAGYPHSVIFGLNLPQLTAIAKPYGRNLPLATELWADSHVRESRLLAAYLFPTDMRLEEAKEVCATVATPEEADLLAFRWLRFLPQAAELLAYFQPLTTKEAQWLATALARFVQ